MATMHGRRGVDRRFMRRGDEVAAEVMVTPDVIVGDGSMDGDGSSLLEVHIGLTL